MYQPTEEEVAKLENNFSYHEPKGDQQVRYAAIREECLQLASCISLLCPNSRERALALTKLEEVMFWANASIARNE